MVDRTERKRQYQREYGRKYWADMKYGKRPLNKSRMAEVDKWVDRTARELAELDSQMYQEDNYDSNS